MIRIVRAVLTAILALAAGGVAAGWFTDPTFGRAFVATAVAFIVICLIPICAAILIHFRGDRPKPMDRRSGWERVAALTIACFALFLGSGAMFAVLRIYVLRSDLQNLKFDASGLSFMLALSGTLIVVAAICAIATEFVGKPRAGGIDI